MPLGECVYFYKLVQNARNSAIVPPTRALFLAFVNKRGGGGELCANNLVRSRRAWPGAGRQRGGDRRWKEWQHLIPAKC